MSWIVLLLVVLALFFVLSARKGQGGGAGKVAYPYQRAKPLFSAAERSFIGVLDQAVGPEYRVFGKVRIADLAAVKPGLGNSARQGALNRIASKHMDFVVCRADDLSVVCAFELNDKSHASQRAKSRDEVVDNVCRAIGLPLVMVPAQAAYSPHEVRNQFLAAASPSSNEGSDPQ